MGPKLIFASQVTDSHATDKEGVGTLRYEADGKVYRYVKNNNASNGFGAGNLVTHELANGATASQAITTPATADLTFFAGVVASTTLTISSGATPYGWIQVAGPVTSPLLASGTVTAGAQYIPTNNASYGSSITAASITSSFYDRYLRITGAGSMSANGVVATACTASIRGCLVI